MDRVKIKRLKLHQDERGLVAEILRREELGEKKSFGQIYLTTANPGFVKGNHYHQRKTEWFTVVKGEGKLFLEDLESGEKEEILMNEKENFLVVEVSPQVAHAIKNTGKEVLYLLAYIDEPYNPDDPDTFPYQLAT